MTYDLRRLRQNGLIHRIPTTNRYILTDGGIRVAVFYTKVYNRTVVLVQRKALVDHMEIGVEERTSMHHGSPFTR
ncbi:hypothetical protein Franean1_4389 [Parafrankia sp. EAN1pec]|uniref:hypothetical protein n=1 Tax=Parafrankia sp. (strain EAN1pec) TaxID=298653 RepID=UPI0000540D35|nr:hypothetical protein Franean1_4389 [Frankia sp. EAN1pec]